MDRNVCGHPQWTAVRLRPSTTRGWTYGSTWHLCHTAVVFEMSRRRTSSMTYRQQSEESTQLTRGGSMDNMSPSGPMENFGAVPMLESGNGDAPSAIEPDCQTLESRKHLLPDAEGMAFPSDEKNKDYVGRTSFGMSVFNFSNAIMGSGILGLAFGMASTGLVSFTILLSAVTIMSIFSVYLLLETAEHAQIKSFEQMGFSAFKWFGKVIASLSVMLQNIGAMSTYLFIIKKELPALLEEITSTNAWKSYFNGEIAVIIAALFVILPLCSMRNIGHLGYSSTFSLGCMAFFQIVIIYKKFSISCETKVENGTTMYQYLYLTDYNQTQTGWHSCKPEIALLNQKTIYAIPIAIFAYVAHPEVLPIYKELKNASKKRMLHVSYVSMITMFIMYILTAIFGYLTFYAGVEDEMLHTYLLVQGFDTAIVLVRIAVIIAVTLTVPVVLFPMRSSLEEIFLPNREFNWFRHIVIAVLLIGFDVLLVIFVPRIKDIFGPVGATAGSLLIFILPSAFFLKLVPKHKHSGLFRIGVMCFLIVGFTILIFNNGIIFASWIKGE
uniref:sodium-coupled neutral amino acid symporter 2-like isoform X1 n=2 Tax=Myxine glutinosa TaxID=7769 RepID=UPI00358DFDBB